MAYRKNARLIFPLVALIFTYLLYKTIVGSVFLQKKDRINVLFYGPKTVFYSLAFHNVNYLFRFPTNSEIEIPGGYGRYRIGALGKLVSLERKHTLFKKAFSAASSSFVDLYFYPKADTIYYNDSSSSSIPSGVSIFLNSSNANLLDRFLLYIFFLQKPKNQYEEITDLPKMTGDSEALFDRETFFKRFQGFFYNKTYRNIGDRVQILYTNNYKTAVLISNIIEGEGIQVVDLSQIKASPGTCQIIYSQKKNNDPTPGDLQRFFGCAIQKGATDVSDIILVLGELEKDWSIN